jgi:DNA-binding CsgD family transcriptional regulator/tetratricopeptide (TPR) repeat protein
VVDNDRVPRLGSGIPLIARDQEMRQLRAALTASERSEAGAVLVAGDAGVGKTRLLTELEHFARGRGAEVLLGRCLDVDESGLPYLPFLEAFSPLAESSDDIISDAVKSSPALSRLLPQSAGIAVSSAGRTSVTGESMPTHRTRTEQDLGQLQLFSAVLRTLSEISRHRLVVVIIEDLHWADGATRDLLSFLVSRLRDQRILIVGSYRGEDVYRRHPLRGLLSRFARIPAVSQLDLSPFDTQDSRAFVRALVDDPLNVELTDSIVERSEGNPFFAEELLASGSHRRENPFGLPIGLAEVLLTRLEKLSENARKVLRIASVSDSAVTDQEIADLTALAESKLDEALREVVQHHVLVIEKGYYSFRHALLREAVYGDLLPRECVRMHAAYAARLLNRPDGRGRDARLAYHALRSKDLDTAFTALLRAAREAEELGAPGTALRHLEQALGIWDAVGEKAKPPEVDEAKLLHEASHFAAMSGDPERGIAYARAAIQALPLDANDERQAKAWRRLAEALLSRDGTLEEALEAIENAWALLADSTAHNARAWVLATRATIMKMVGRRDDAVFSAQTAVSDARLAHADDAEAFALVTIGILADSVGDFGEAREKLREAERKAIEADSLDVELRALYFQALSHDDQAEVRPALELYRKVILRAEEAGLSWSSLGLESRARLMAMRYLSGDWPDTSAGEHPGSGVSDAVSARLAAEWVVLLVARGQFDDAMKLFPGLRAQWDFEVQIPVSSQDARISLEYWRGDYVSAIAGARETIDWLDQAAPWSLAGIRFGALGLSASAARARQARLRGDSEGADRAVRAGKDFLSYVYYCLEDRRPRSGKLGPEGQAWLRRAEAAASGLEGAGDSDLWARAVTAFDYGAVYEQALCRWYYAEALFSSEKPDLALATKQLSLAYRVADQLDARPLREALRDLAHRAKVSLPGPENPVGQPKGSPADPLTPRERAVLSLVALGRTNRQVGAELYISEKTVSVHLSRVMAKLGASRRGEAVAIAHERGLLAKPSAAG